MAGCAGGVRAHNNILRSICVCIQSVSTGKAGRGLSCPYLLMSAVQNLFDVMSAIPGAAFIATI